MAFFKRRKGLFISALVSIIGFFPLMGAPGFALISLYQWLIAAITNTAYDVEYGDSTWPMAISYAIIFPWVVFFAHLLLKRLPAPFVRCRQGKLGVLMACLIGFLCMFAFHAVFCNPEAIRAERAQLLEELSQR